MSKPARLLDDDMLSRMRTAFEDVFRRLPQISHILFNIEKGGLQDGEFFITGFESQTNTGDIVRSVDVRESFFNWCTAVRFADLIAAKNRRRFFVVERIQFEPISDISHTNSEIAINQGHKAREVAVELIRKGYLAGVDGINYVSGVIFARLANDVLIEEIEGEESVSRVTITLVPFCKSKGYPRTTLV